MLAGALTLDKYHVWQHRNTAIRRASRLCDPCRLKLALASPM